MTAHPAHGLTGTTTAEEGGGDRWLKWEMNDLPKYAKRGTLEILGVLRADELIDFPAFFQRVWWAARLLLCCILRAGRAVRRLITLGAVRSTRHKGDIPVDPRAGRGGALSR